MLLINGVRTLALGERMTSHYVVWDVFVVIGRNVGFHVSWSKTMSFYPLPCSLHVVESTLYYQSMVSACWQTLSLSTPLKFIWFCGCFFSQVCYNSHNLSKGWFLSQSIPNEHVYPTSRWIFSSMCQHGVGGVKGIASPPLLILRTFYKHRVSVALQSAQTICILKHGIVVNEGLSRLSVFLGGSPLSLFNMLLTTRGGSRTWCSPSMVCPLRWFICLFGCGSSILFLASRFLGASVNLSLAGFHQLGIAYKLEQDTKSQGKKSVHIQTNLSL